MKTRWQAWAVLLFLVSLAGCDTQEPRPGEAQHLDGTLRHGLLQRTYVLHVPPQAAAGEPLPLLLMLHGALGSAHHMHEAYGMDALADEHGFLVVYPDGVSPTGDGNWRTWNAAHCCGLPDRFGVDDVGFLAALIDRIDAHYPVDPARIGVAGHSNGAMMAFQFAAVRSDLVASVAGVAGSVGGQRNATSPVEQSPDPQHPVAALIIHARDDPNVSYTGGTPTASLDPDRIDLPFADTVRFWVEAAGLDGPATAWEENGVAYERWGQASGIEVLGVTTTGGHGWPGGTGIPGFIQAPSAPNATHLVADFFLAHPKS